MSHRHTDFDLRQTATTNHHLIDVDWPKIAWRFAYWGTLVGFVLLLLFLYSKGNPIRVGKISDGTAIVNQVGTVVIWTDGAEAVTGIERKRMIGNDVFYAVPESNRTYIRKCFERSIDDDRLYPWPQVKFPGATGEVQLTFRREGDYRIEAVFSR